MIKAITFDLDGVYFINGKSNFISSLGRMGVSEEDARRVFLQSPQMNELYKTGKMSDDEFWSWAISEWGIRMTVPEVIQLLLSGYEVNTRVEEVVRKVKSSGYKTLVCTNNFPARIKGLQERFSFLDNFDVAVLSYEEGLVKPQVEIFEVLVKKAGVVPEEIFLADDTQAVLDSASALGIQTVHYTDFNAFIEKLQALGVRVGA